MPGLAGMPELAGVRHSFVDVATGLRMHVAEAGDPAAPAVLLLHGFPQNWWEWRKVITPLAERYRVIVPDLRGAGWTEVPADGYEVGPIAADVLALLDALGLERVGLIGHDFSAFVGYRLCFDSPERIAGYLCLGPHPYMNLSFSPKMLRGVAQLWFQPVVATPVLGPWALRRRAFARHILTGFAGSGDQVRDEDLEVFTGRLQDGRRPEAGSALYRNLILPEMVRLITGKYATQRLRVPTVALLGGDDPGVSADMLEITGDPADDLAGHVVDRAAHYIADDRPDAVVGHAMELFGRVL